MIAMHSQDGSHFLGLRQGRAGGYEIVYEATKTGKRLIWHIKNSLVTEGDITQQLERALEASAVLETFYAGLCSAVTRIFEQRRLRPLRPAGSYEI